MVFDVHGALQALERGDVPVVAISTVERLQQRFCRAAAAAREARQASIHTLLRYYHLGGSVERYCAAVALDRAHPSGARYIAALQGKSINAIYARRYRVRSGAGERQRRVEEAPMQASADESASRHDRRSLPRINRLLSAAAVKGVVLHLAGCSLQVASDHVVVPIGVVKPLYLTVRSDLERAEVARIDPLFARADTTWGKSLEPACEWSFRHRWHLSTVLVKGGGFTPRGAEIRISGALALDRAGVAWKELSEKGIQPIVYLSARQPLEDRSAFRERAACSIAS